ncbi:hypothetical protein PILCRDRAFT_2588 [Piloderma croceum F 1598]|uniref:Nephrocystin 3-like N-terminal domain-containing protein n=1 Tax=Piloderma croceum (strain F 1598) TaxID=765440 RepID=A0A0C3CHU8_PILCF|nr:hypothetical protein PILCRDRAFT_2588 [Piloderma croceum F 1598]
MDEAVSQGLASYEKMKHLSSPLDRAKGVVDDSVSVLNNAGSVTVIWGPFLQKVERLMGIVDDISEIHPYAKIAWTVLSAAYKIVIAQKKLDEVIDHLVEVMNDIYSFVQEAHALRDIESHKWIVALITQQTTDCAYFIRDYTINKSFWSRTVKNFTSDADNRIKRYEAKFLELKLAFQGRALIHTEITVLCILDNVENIAEEIDLNDMLYAEGARFDPEKVCLPHTRDDVINKINRWINSANGDDVARIFYLSGVAGSGKSTIAHTITHQYEWLGRLGSLFCFEHSDQINRRPDNMFSTIACDLADLDPERK